MSEIKITNNNFDKEVLKSEKPVLVDFWASWCGPCRMVGPIVEEIANEYDGKISVGKINVDEEPELSSQFGISSIPTLMVFKNGKVVNTAIGYRPKNEIIDLIV